MIGKDLLIWERDWKRKKSEIQLGNILFYSLVCLSSLYFIFHVILVH